MAQNLNDNISIKANKPIDNRYLNISTPWASTSTVNSTILPSYRYTGLTVNILGDEYWYKDGIGNGDLVVKSLGGILNSVTNGLHLIGGGVISLGGTLTGNTIFNGTASKYNLQYGGNYSTNYSNRSLVDKEYVDTYTSGLKPKNAVKAATVSGITLSGLSTIDGYVLTTGDRILVKNQINEIDNGIYSGSSGSWGRTSDFANGLTGVTGSYIYVLTGNTNKNYAYILTSENPIVGVDSLIFVEFSHIQDVTQGIGILVSGTTYGHEISFDGSNVAGTCLSWDGSKLNLDASSQNVLGYGITGATNGITKYNANNISLGGILTGSTMLSLPFSSQSSFTIGNGSVVNWYGGKVKICRDNVVALNNMAMIGARTDSSNCSTIITCATSGISMLSNIGNTTHSMKLGNNALAYDACYHTSYVNRTLVDKEYVDNNISGIDASNGLTRIGNNITLGGILTGNTTIVGDSYSLCFGTNSSKLCEYCVYATTAAYVADKFEITTCDATITDYATNPEGLKYGACYHPTYTNRSLVDKEYVDNTMPFTGGTNGLSIYGKNIGLGGTLTADTKITISNHKLCLASDSSVGYGLAKFSLNTAYASSYYCVCSRDSGMTGNWWGFTGNSTSISSYHCSNVSNGSRLVVYNTGITLSNKTSNINKTVSLGVNGLAYASDYSSCFVNRSLVDKQYVDYMVTGHSNIITVNNVGSVYTTLSTDEFIGVSGTTCIYLYSTPACGQKIIVADICGNASSDPITIDGNGKKINNSLYSGIKTNYGSISYLYNGYCWSVIGFVN